MPTMTAKGQVTIPEPIRRQMGWKPGDKLAFAIVDGQVVVRKATGAKELLGLARKLARQFQEVAAAAEGIPGPEDRAWEAVREQAWRVVTERVFRA